MSDVISKLSPILRFVKGEGVTTSTITFLLGKVGINIPEEVAHLAVSTVKGLMQEKGYQNLGQVVKDPEFAVLLEVVTSKLATSQAMVALERQKTQADYVESKDFIHIHSAIRCPHCELPFALNDAVGRYI